MKRLHAFCLLLLLLLLFRVSLSLISDGSWQHLMCRAVKKVEYRCSRDMLPTHWGKPAEEGPSGAIRLTRLSLVTAGGGIQQAGWGLPGMLLLQEMVVGLATHTPAFLITRWGGRLCPTGKILRLGSNQVASVHAKPEPCQLHTL